MVACFGEKKGGVARKAKTECVACSRIRMLVFRRKGGSSEGSVLLVSRNRKLAVGKLAA